MSGYQKSPYRSAGLKAQDILGTGKNAGHQFNSSAFTSVDEYAQFCQEHKVYGGDAVKLKKQIDKAMLPNFKPTRSKNNG